RYGERGHAAWALRARAAAEARDQDGMELAAQSYGQALAVAQELEMGPLAAQCRLSLGELFAGSDKLDQARIELAAARELFTTMAMEPWRVRAARVLDELR